MPNTLPASIVIPVFNEEMNLPRLFDEIAQAMRSSARTWEVVFVDDGSTDQSLAVLKHLATDNPEVRYLAFTRNRGQSAAFCAGFDSAEHPVVVTLDADLQNDLEQTHRLEDRQRHQKPPDPRIRTRHRLLAQGHAPRHARAHPALQGHAPLPADADEA